MGDKRAAASETWISGATLYNKQILPSRLGRTIFFILLSRYPSTPDIVHLDPNTPLSPSRLVAKQMLQFQVSPVVTFRTPPGCPSP
ncbi:hypothetical protein XA68_12385 [Ophiocordyceps unilateralis]|uniref:Uncharacterized protein n=1 Tax=Ophiocordyceps unilateralis TaxID=268505 RepID=A0A2A9PPA0_OPHUN|nr:hypothetical protein XA68_12385 [Ophiocordyceps unilateralis]